MALLGRVVDALGVPIDGKGALSAAGKKYGRRRRRELTFKLPLLPPP